MNCVEYHWKLFMKYLLYSHICEGRSFKCACLLNNKILKNWKHTRNRYYFSASDSVLRLTVNIFGIWNAKSSVYKPILRLTITPCQDCSCNLSMQYVNEVYTILQSTIYSELMCFAWMIRGNRGNNNKILSHLRYKGPRYK